MTFKEWILNFTNINLPIGKLAREIELDFEFPHKANYEDFLNYLNAKDASYEFIEVFKLCWQLYFNEPDW